MKIWKNWPIILALIIGIFIFQSCAGFSPQVTITPGGSIFNTTIHTIRIINGLDYDIMLSYNGRAYKIRRGGGISVPFQKYRYVSSVAFDGTVFDGRMVVGTVSRLINIPVNRHNRGNTARLWHITSYKKIRR